MSKQITVSYSAWLGDDKGNRLRYIGHISHVEAWLGLNGISNCRLEFPLEYQPGKEFEYDLIQEDSWIELWRSIDGKTSKLLDDTIFFTVKRERFTNSNGKQVIGISAYSADQVAQWPIVAYDSGTSQAKKSGPADDLIKEFASENFGSDATDTDRDLSDYIDIAGDVSLAPTVNKLASRRHLDRVFNELCEKSATAGTRLYWAIVAKSPGTSDKKLELRTYIGQRGIDRGSTSTNPTVFSPGRNNLRGAHLIEDWSNSWYYVYALGQGREDVRIEKTASDNDRIAQSIWGRLKESYRDARHIKDPDAVQDEADSKLREGRPRQVLSGRAINTPARRFGIEWNHGDIVQCEAYGLTFDALTSPMHLVYTGKKETIDLLLVSEDV